MAAVAAGMRAIGYAADSDEHALRNADGETIIRSLDMLPELLVPELNPGQTVRSDSAQRRQWRRWG